MTEKEVRSKPLQVTSGLAQAGHWLARKFVQFWKFIARPNSSGSPACAKPLGRYTQWRNFVNIIDKAKDACQNAGESVEYHFADVSKTIPMPKGAEKEIDNILLSVLPNLQFGSCEY